MTLRSARNFDRRLLSLATGLACEDESLAVQSQKDEADINLIVKRFGVTGMLPQTVRIPQYADFDEVFDFQSAMNVVRQAQEAFNELPAELRRKFSNDPQEFLEFCQHEENLPILKKFGLAVERPPEAASEAGAGTPPAATAQSAVASSGAAAAGTGGTPEGG